jgi:hypothetical protein
MTKKPPKKGMEEPEAQYRQELPMPSEADWDEIDRWIERNKDALSASFERADAEFARGEYRTLDEVMAHIRAQAKRRQTLERS